MKIKFFICKNYFIALTTQNFFVVSGLFVVRHPQIHIFCTLLCFFCTIHIFTISRSKSLFCPGFCCIIVSFTHALKTKSSSLYQIPSSSLPFRLFSYLSLLLLSLLLLPAHSLTIFHHHQHRLTHHDFIRPM